MISNAKITYLFHSSFLVETNNHILIFDFFDFTDDHNIDKIIPSSYFNTKKDVYVFATHGHKDHYDPKIFNWLDINPNIQYILSDDISGNKNIENCTFMKKYESKKFNNISIRTYGTTDLGLSFLVEVDGLSIYHAGDLNWWHWKKSSNEEQKKEEVDFKREVEKIKVETIDIAFIPVDPNLEEYFYLGGEYFIETIKPNLLVPMHFGDHVDGKFISKYYVCGDFIRRVKSLETKVFVISDENKELIYNNTDWDS